MTSLLVNFLFWSLFSRSLNKGSLQEGICGYGSDGVPRAIRTGVGREAGPGRLRTRCPYGCTNSQFRILQRTLLVKSSKGRKKRKPETDSIFTPLLPASSDGGGCNRKDFSQKEPPGFSEE